MNLQILKTNLANLRKDFSDEFVNFQDDILANLREAVSGEFVNFQNDTLANVHDAVYKCSCKCNGVFWGTGLEHHARRWCGSVEVQC